MGNLVAIWTDVPTEVDSMEQLAEEFASYFGHPWAAVMAGAENPYQYHSYWYAYVAVANVKECRGLTVPGLTGSTKFFQQKHCHIIAG